MNKSIYVVIIVALVLGLNACGSGSDSAPGSQITNNTPTIDTTFGNLSIEGNSGTTSYELNVSDIEGDSLTLSVESNDTSIITITQNWTNPLLQANYDGITLDFNLTTVTNAYGDVKITITLQDNDKNVTTSFDVNISEVILHKGLTYKTVTSPYTGKIWLDRNLGASQVCTDLNDTACYGDYYQWGRNTDGHQVSTSAVTATQATDINNAGTDFIAADATYGSDWAQATDTNGTLRAVNWSKTDGSSVCPLGYRVPTLTELRVETLDNNASDPFATTADAFNNFLKLPSAGYRGREGGSITQQGSRGSMWTSSASGSASGYLSFLSASVNVYNGGRSYAWSVRCLKD